jgi:acyl carrier protein
MQKFPLAIMVRGIFVFALSMTNFIIEIDRYHFYLYGLEIHLNYEFIKIYSYKNKFMETITINQADIEKRIKSIIAWKLGVKEKDIKPQSIFSENFYADEFDMVELIMELEKEFNISIPDGKIEKTITVSEAVQNVTELEEKKLRFISSFNILVGPLLYDSYYDKENKSKS